MLVRKAWLAIPGATAGADFTMLVDDKEEKVEVEKVYVVDDERRDRQALKILEHQRRRAVLEEVPRARISGQKRGRTWISNLEDEPASKRQRQRPSAVLLDTGRSTINSTATSLVNARRIMFMTASLAFQPGPYLHVRRGGCAGARADARRMLVLGGQSGQLACRSTEFMDLKSMSMYPGPNMRTARFDSAAVMIDSQRMMVIGGRQGIDTGRRDRFLDSTEVINIVTQEVRSGPYLNFNRSSAAVAMIGTSHLMVLGGRNDYGCMDTTEILNIHRAPWQFESGPKLCKKRAGATVTMVDNTRLLVIGGTDGSKIHGSTEILHLRDTGRDPPTIVSALGPFVVTPRSYSASLMLNSGHLFIIGGHNGVKTLNTTEVLRLSNMEFTNGPTMQVGRAMCTAAMSDDGRVVVVGGTTDGEGEHYSTEVLSLPQYSFPIGPWIDGL